jgi:sphingomyelin phosphodiesterase 2
VRLSIEHEVDVENPKVESFSATLLGFPHKIQHGDWFCGKLIGLCKILVHGQVVINVYNTHLHANYHHVIPKDIYLGHRICQAYELIQFIESTSSADSTDLTLLLGDLNLRTTDLGFQLIQNILQLHDCFLQRVNKVGRRESSMEDGRRGLFSGFV